MIDGTELMAHWPLLVNYVAKRLPDADLTACEDIAADAVERALTKYRELGHPDGLRRWLVTVTRNAVLDYRRSPERRRIVPPLPSDGKRARLDAGSERHLVTIDVQAALAQLPEDDRQIVWRRCALGMSRPEATGLSDTRAYRRYNRAIAALRTAYREEAAS